MRASRDIKTHYVEGKKDETGGTPQVRLAFSVVAFDLVPCWPFSCGTLVGSRSYSIFIAKYHSVEALFSLICYLFGPRQPC